MQPVVVTAQQIYEQLITLTREVQSLGGRIDRLADGQDAVDRDLEEHKQDDRHRLQDHETRLRGVERRLWLAAGGAMTLGGVGGWLASMIGVGPN